MSLSSSTLAAIQKVGAAAFVADEKLKKEANEYAARVSSAVSKDAYGKGNDALIEGWKVVSRLSQTLAGIEEEIQKVFKTATQLASVDQVTEPTVSMLPTHNPSVSKAKKVIAASVVKPTRQKKALKVVVKKVAKKAVAPKTKAVKVKPAADAGKAVTLGGNPTKLLAYFKRTLNPNGFSEVSQTSTSQATGIPLGSMTAAIKKLAETKQIEVAADGGIKLMAMQATEQVAG